MEEGRERCEVNLWVNLCLTCVHGWHYRVASKVFWRCWASDGSLMLSPRDQKRFVTQWENLLTYRRV